MAIEALGDAVPFYRPPASKTRRRGDPVVRRPVGQLDAPGVEKGAGADEEGVGSLACKRRERCIAAVSTSLTVP